MFGGHFVWGGCFATCVSTCVGGGACFLRVALHRLADDCSATALCCAQTKSQEVVDLKKRLARYEPQSVPSADT